MKSLNVNFFIREKVKGVFRTQSNIYNGAFLYDELTAIVDRSMNIFRIFFFKQKDQEMNEGAYK